MGRTRRRKAAGVDDLLQRPARTRSQKGSESGRSPERPGRKPGDEKRRRATGKAASLSPENGRGRRGTRARTRWPLAVLTADKPSGPRPNGRTAQWLILRPPIRDKPPRV